LKGRLNKQIAGDIGVSEVTVKAHRGQVMRKMKASSVLDLARMAEKLKLTPETLQASHTIAAVADSPSSRSAIRAGGHGKVKNGT
jgi:hypothetical protein